MEHSGPMDLQHNEMLALEGCVGPLGCIIALTPSGDADYVAVDLVVSLPLDYPNAIPSIKVENKKGISRAQIAQMRIQISNLSEELLGEEMIFQITQEVLAYLSEHNKPLLSGSLHALMLEKELAIKAEAANKARERRKEEQSLYKAKQSKLVADILQNLPGPNFRSPGLKRESSDIYANSLDSLAGEEEEEEEEEGETDASAEEEGGIGEAVRGSQEREEPPTPEKALQQQRIARASSGDSRQTGEEDEEKETESEESEGDSSEMESDDEASKLADFDSSFQFTPGLDFRNKKGLGWGVKASSPKTSKGRKSTADSAASEKKGLHFREEIKPAATAAPLLSRYKMDFQEMHVLGRGGFGTVVQAQNNMDGMTYAVKKMRVFGDDDRRVRREVVAIACLQHRHIVRYYNAWYEDLSTLSAEDLKSLGHDEELDSMNPSSNSVSLLHDEDLPPYRELGATLGGSGFSTDHNRGRPAGPTVGGRVLYIQMEYCSSKTLRNIIDEFNGDAFQDTSRQKHLWRLFRQLLEALDYVHSHKTMHRDIKPDNIFIDTKGNVKLGDFGLAVRPATKIPEPYVSLRREDSTEFRSSHQQMMHTQRTQEVGTAFYTAPEAGIGGRYHLSSDMFSLGIVFFEMWRPFETNMERAQTLTRLRSKDGFLACIEESFPDNAVGQKIKKVAAALLRHDAKERPTVQKLLKSNLIPMEETYIQSALMAVKDPESNFLRTVLDQIFSSSSPEHLDYTFEGAALSRWMSEQQSAGGESVWYGPHAAKTLASELISGVFKLHGAVHISPAVLVPSTAKMNLHKDFVRVLDDQGNLLQLPSNLTQNFARSIAQSLLHSGASELRRFDVSKVLEKNPMGPKPHEQYLACFDIVWDRETSFPGPAGVRDAVYRAETISALDEVTNSLGLLGTTVIRVSHTALLPALIDICIAQSGQSLSPSCYDEEIDVDELLRVISQTKLECKEDYRLLRRRLLSRLPDEESVYDMVDLLLTFLEVKGPVKAALAQLKQMTFVQTELANKHSTRPALRQSIRELEELQKILVAFRFDDVLQDKPERSPVLLDLSFIPSTKVYEGFVFAVMSPHVQSPLAVGGCYEHLVQMFRLPQMAFKHGQTAEVPEVDGTDAKLEPNRFGAVGCTIHIKAVLSSLRIFLEQQPQRNLGTLESVLRGTIARAPANGRNGVLLFEIKKRLLKERAQVAQHLWRCSQHCEYSWPEGLDLKQAIQYCALRGFGTLAVFPFTTYPQKGEVEVYTVGHASLNLTTKQIKGTGKKMLVKELTNHIRQSGQTDGASQAASSSGGSSTKDSVGISLVETKSGKYGGRRRQLVQRARQHMGSILNAVPRAVAFAVELPVMIIRGTMFAHQSKRDGKWKGKVTMDGVSQFLDKNSEALVEALLNGIRALPKSIDCIFIFSLVDDKFDMFSV